MIKQLQTHFKAKREKGMETLFPSHSTPGCWQCISGTYLRFPYTVTQQTWERNLSTPEETLKFSFFGRASFDLPSMSTNPVSRSINQWKHLNCDCPGCVSSKL